MESRDPIRIARRVVLLEDVFYQRDVMNTAVRADQSQTALDRIGSPDGELGQRRVQAGLDKPVGRPLGHGPVMAAQVVTVRVIVRPFADSVIVKRVQQRRLVLRQHGRILDLVLSLPCVRVRVPGGLSIDAALKPFPVTDTGRHTSRERQERNE